MFFLKMFAYPPGSNGVSTPPAYYHTASGIPEQGIVARGAAGFIGIINGSPDGRIECMWWCNRFVGVNP